LKATTKLFQRVHFFKLFAHYFKSSIADFYATMKIILKIPKSLRWTCQTSCEWFWEKYKIYELLSKLFQDHCQWVCDNCKVQNDVLTEKNYDEKSKTISLKNGSVLKLWFIFVRAMSERSSQLLGLRLLLVRIYHENFKLIFWIPLRIPIPFKSARFRHLMCL